MCWFMQIKTNSRPSRRGGRIKIKNGFLLCDKKCSWYRSVISTVGLKTDASLITQTGTNDADVIYIFVIRRL